MEVIQYHGGIMRGVQMVKKFWLASLALFILFFLAACSEDKANSESPEEKQPEVKDEEKVEEIPEYEEKEVEYYEIENTYGRELTEIEKKLLRKPGEFSGDHYDEQKVKEKLDQLPGDLTSEQYFNEILYLLHEDFHKEVETFVNFDSTVDVNITRPDETVDTPTLKTTHYALLIDASGSMAGQVGGKTKMETAKEAVQEFASNIPGNATISLRVYGHKGTGNDSDKALSCSSTEKLYGGHYDEQQLKTAVNSIKPAGWTPIGLALNSVYEDIPEGTDDVIVYVVSDGIETCDGDPVASAKKLAGSNIQTVVNIIGFDVDNEGQKLLKEVADAGNGQFTYVNSEKEFKKYMREQYEQIQKQWFEWKEAGKKEAFELKEEKKKLAFDTKESVKEKSDRQKERMKNAQDYLKEKYPDDYDHPVRDTWGMIIDYAGDVWSYGVDTGNDAWSESVENGNNEWSDYVNEGNEKIRETIEKKNSQ